MEDVVGLCGFGKVVQRFEVSCKGPMSDRVEWKDIEVKLTSNICDTKDSNGTRLDDAAVIRKKSLCSGSRTRGGSVG